MVDEIVELNEHAENLPLDMLTLLLPKNSMHVVCYKSVTVFKGA